LTKILWVSRHKALEVQKKDLVSVFGEIEIKYYENAFDNAEEIVNYFRKNKFDEMVIVAPLSVISKVVELGIKPLYAKMDLIKEGDYDVENKGRKYKFDKFMRINNIFIDFKNLRRKK